MGQLNPIVMDKIVLPVYDIFRGTSRQKFSSVLQRTQWLSRDKIERLQEDNLRVLLKYAYENVPYYRRIFRKRGLTPSEIKGVDDLEKLPILTKADLRKNFKDLISRNYPKSNLIRYTSGGTGDPVIFYITTEKLSWEIAAEFRAYSWAGYNLGDTCFLIWGSPSDLSKRKNIISHFTRFFENIHTVNALNQITDEILNVYVSSMKKIKPKIVRGYAHSIYLLAKFMLEKNIECAGIKSVITTAETLLDSRRKIIEEAFDCPVFDCYGSREVGAIAAECEKHEGYHVSAENVVLECTKNGEKVAPGEFGEILVTNLRNFGMPLIRYKIGDVGVQSDEICSCGRGLPLLSSLEGRMIEFLTIFDRKSNKKIPISPVVFQIALGQLPLKQYQIFQDRLDRIIIKIVKDNGYLPKHKEFLMNHLHHYIDNGTKIDIEYVDNIPPMPSGKRPLSISRINPFEE